MSSGKLGEVHRNLKEHCSLRQATFLSAFSRLLYIKLCCSSALSPLPELPAGQNPKAKSLQLAEKAGTWLPQRLAVQLRQPACFWVIRWEISSESRVSCCICLLQAPPEFRLIVSTWAILPFSNSLCWCFFLTRRISVAGQILNSLEDQRMISHQHLQRSTVTTKLRPWDSEGFVLEYFYA